MRKKMICILVGDFQQKHRHQPTVQTSIVSVEGSLNSRTVMLVFNQQLNSGEVPVGTCRAALRPISFQSIPAARSRDAANSDARLCV